MKIEIFIITESLTKNQTKFDDMFKHAILLFE